MMNMTKRTQGLKRKRRPRTKNLYFTKVHENAIIEYAQTRDNKIRTELYVNFIQPAFHEMVEKIIFTYKFNNLPNIDPLKEECKIWLTTILDKYDPNKGSKAFSYFSVITKNWFIHKVKQTSRRAKREVDFETVAKEVDEKLVDNRNVYVEKRERKEFWDNLWLEIESWRPEMMKDNEKKVYEAIRILLTSVDDIEIYNKKAIYLYLRELTDLNTKQVVNQLNKMRKKYKIFKKNWDSGKI